MRRFLLATFALILLVLAGGAAALYVLRDQLLLSQLRARSAQLAPLKLEVAGLRTEVLGPFQVTLSGLELSYGEISVKAREARLSSPLGLLALYRAYQAKTELPLDLSVTDSSVKLPATKAAESGKAEPMKWPERIELPALPPLPLKASIAVKGAQVDGPVGLRQLSASLAFRAAGPDLSLDGEASGEATFPGAQAPLPVAASLKASATPKLVKLDSFTLKAAGLEAAGSGELGLAPVVGKFRLDASVPDLSRLSLRPEDKAALGLTAQPAGAFTLKLAGGAAAGKVKAGGQLLLSGAAFTLRQAGLEGPVRVHAEAPAFVVEHTLTGKGMPTLTGTLVASADLSAARVSRPGQLEKPAGVQLRTELEAALAEDSLQLKSLTFDFHTLRLRASGEVARPFGAPAARVVSATFRAEAKSLEGFPALLPLLREKAAASGASLEEAQGAVLAEGRVRLLPEAPAKSTVELKALSLKGVRLPLAWKNEKAAASGLLLATLTGSGRYDAGALDVSAATGSADLSGLALELPGLAKKRGKKLLVSFDAKGNPAKLQVRKASLEADGLRASLSGTISTATKGRADLALSSTVAAELGPLREYLPKLPMKISNGSLTADAKVSGAWLFEGGVEKSPLQVAATARGKLGTVEMPEAAAQAANAEKREAAPLLPPWPVARKLRLGYRFELGSFRRGALEASGIVAEGQLIEGRFTGTASVAKAFGGSARLTQLQGSLTEPALPVRGAASAEGMDLSRMAGFVDPSYGQLVKGTLKAESTFSVPDVFAENLMTAASAKGKAEIKNGYVSTASLDQMVNAKLAGLPGVGDKAKVKTGGMAADMRTNFEVAGGTATLTDFFAVTPRKDEMRMNGTMNLAFDADMKGEAHIVDAPVKGSFREANSDAEGRLVVPIHFRGNLKNPSVEIANEIIERMAGNMARHEAEKLKSKAVEEGKKKLEEEAKKAGGNLLKGIFKR